MMDVWRPFEDYHAVNVTGTENVCRTALAAGVRRVVHMSSSSVYGMALGRPADERRELRPFRDPYPQTKAAGDSAVQRMIVADRLPAVIVRPDQIFGPGDHLHFGRMADRLRAGKGLIVGKGDNALPLVYVDDLVQGLLLALDHDRAVGQAYNIGNDRPLSQAQLLRARSAQTRHVSTSPTALSMPPGTSPSASQPSRRRRGVRPSHGWGWRSQAPTTAIRSTRRGASWDTRLAWISPRAYGSLRAGTWQPTMNAQRSRRSRCARREP